tara:strand:+ start:836 stop:1093 length:258 start_codon:yes stop_codon:yes gene_type:complete
MISKCFGIKFYCLCTKENNQEFDIVDTNSDGKISLNEFHNYYLKKFGKPPTNDQWFKFHLADKNNDGYITEEECKLFESANTIFQ